MIANTPVIDPQLHKKLQTLRRLKQLKDSNGLAFYKPFPKQDKFHSAGGYKRRYLQTGNRFGKSTCGAAEDAAWAIGERPWYPLGDPRRTAGIPKHSTKGLIIVADWDKAREIFTNNDPGTSRGKLMEMLPANAIDGRPHKNQGGEVDCIRVKSIYGGISTIYIDTVKSFMSNPMGQESSNWDWIHVDEPCPQEMWVANARGLVDRDGSAWFTCTPINYMWINDMFVPPTRIREVFNEALVDEETSRWTISGTIWDNPTHTKAAIDRFIGDMPEDEREARLEGRPRALSGAIYKEFDRDKHVYDFIPKGWKSHNQPPDGYTIRVSIDPHPRTPHAVLFAATAPSGETFFFSEIFKPCLIETLCYSILQTVEQHNVSSYICDPLAFIENPIDGRSMADVFYQFNIPVEKAVKDPMHGIMRVRQELMKPKTLFFSSSLTETMFEFDRYVWDPKKEKPVDANDHMMECLYRLVLTGLHYIPPDSYVFKKTQPMNFRKSDFSLPTLPRQLNPRTSKSRYGR